MNVRRAMASTLKSRFLVIGSGIAGLQYALLAAKTGTVNIVTKKESTESNTNYAQGGIAAVMSPLDTFDIHIADTVTAGDGLCNSNTVREMVESSPGLINQLLEYGVEFSQKDDQYALGREGGHSCNRILHSADMTGRELENKLLQQCLNNPNISIWENHIALDLVDYKDLCIEEESRIVGCVVLGRNDHSRKVFLAENTILATGGCGKVYAYTSNPDIATGDGMAIAYRAGATLANLEFVQFHPTCLYHPDAKSYLISEAVRGEGALLTNSRGEYFMDRYHPLKDLAPRDIVARAIDHELKLSGDKCVYLDLRHIEPELTKSRFPNLYNNCLKFGFDMTTDLVPVVPAAHYMCGGILVDEGGKSSIDGLYAIGEVACTGVHGANRLASNSLLEAVYFARKAADATAKEHRVNLPNEINPLLFCSSQISKNYTPMVLEHDWDSVRKIMWDYVGIVRSNMRLGIALKRIRSIRKTVEIIYSGSIISPDLVELRNISLIAEMIILSALSRHESRGLHYTVDYPEKSLAISLETKIGANEELYAIILNDN
jgi:L-aspartate oxidase